MDDRKFDAVFDKWDSDHDGYWTWQDCMRRGRDQRKVFDPFGWVASFLEFGVTFWVSMHGVRLLGLGCSAIHYTTVYLYMYIY